jgi:Protein of unknown function (DUF3102)
MKAIAISQATEANEAHERIVSVLSNTVLDAIAIGEFLTEKQTTLSHGEWLPWIAANLTFDRRTATNYMRLLRIGTSSNGNKFPHLTEANFLALRYCALCRLLLLCSAYAGLAGGLAGRPKLCPRQVYCPAALRINRVISSGCEISERWLAFTSMVWAPIRLAMKRSSSGLMVRSSVETA